MARQRRVGFRLFGHDESPVSPPFSSAEAPCRAPLTAFWLPRRSFIKANYPHHEGFWGWEDVADQVVLMVPYIRRCMVECEYLEHMSRGTFDY